MADNGLGEAYRFELEGGGARITYDGWSHLFHYVGPTKPPLDDVVEATETVVPFETSIGRVVTATVGLATDSFVHSVSVLVPRVNLKVGTAGLGQGPVAADAEFHTIGIWTTSLSTEGGIDLVEGPVHLYTHAQMEGTARAPYVFTATLIRRLPRPGVLRVEGGCTFPSSGYEVRLCRREPQGTNPRDLLLDLVIKEPGPDDIVLPAFTTVPVSYEEETEEWFETVTTLPDGPTIAVRAIT